MKADGLEEKKCLEDVHVLQVKGQTLISKLLGLGAIARVARQKAGNSSTLERAKIVCKAAVDLEMRDSPIVAEWIITGTPMARSADHARSAEGSSFSAIWDCTAGTFRWYFHWDETIIILEGQVQITDEDGSSYTLGTGDMAYFPAGTWATWSVDEYVKKAAFLRRPLPFLLATLYRFRNILRDRQGSMAGPVR